MLFGGEAPVRFLKFNNAEVRPFRFEGSQMEFTVSLCGDTGLTITGTQVPFGVCLHSEEDPDGDMLAGAVEVLNPEALCISDKTGRSPIVRVRFLRCSTRQVVLTVRPLSESQRAVVAPFSSGPMKVVHHLLSISNEDQIETPWFKDEGGKGNQITIHVRMTGADGNAVVGRRGVRLKCVLYYENDVLVADQSILVISPDTNMYLGGDGCATIKCRIEEISQRHDSQKFKIMVTPDTIHSPANNDIGHQFSPGILVKSKISKKNREKMMAKEQAEAVLVTRKRSRSTVIDTIPDYSIRNISPANIPGGCGGVGGNVQALTDFATNAVQQLLKVKELLQKGENPMNLIDEILSMQSSLGLPAATIQSNVASLNRQVSFEDRYNVGQQTSFETPDLGPRDEDTDVSQELNGFHLKPRNSFGPDVSRERSLFSEAASNVFGPEHSRENSLHMYI